MNKILTMFRSRKELCKETDFKWSTGHEIKFYCDPSQYENSTNFEAFLRYVGDDVHVVRLKPKPDFSM